MLPVDKDRFLAIKEYKYWTVFLHESQCYIGRVYLLAKENHERDFLEVEGEEREEFFQIGRSIKQALTALFMPDRINYAMLSNKFKKLHVHIIPRYKSSRFFSRIEFIDRRWGQNYAPYNKSFIIPQNTHYEIRDAICMALSLIQLWNMDN